MKKYLLIAIFSISNHIFFAQGWEKAIGQDYQDMLRGICQVPSGEIVVAGWTYGTTEAFGKPGNFVACFTENGTLKWKMTMNEAVYTQSHDVVYSSDGSVVVSSSLDGYAYLLKLSLTDGSIIWEKAYNSGNTPLQYGSSIVKTTDGGFVFTGAIDLGTGNYDAYLYKINSNGDSIWFKTYGDSTYQVSMKVSNSSNGFIVSGDEGNGYAQGYLFKTDFDGNLIWEKRFGNLLSAGVSVTESDNGDVFVCGNNWQETDSLNVVYVSKFTSSGDSVWYKEYNTDKYNNTYDITTMNGELVLLNTFLDSNNINDIEVITLNLNGNVLNRKTYGSTGSDRAYSLIQNSKGGYAFCGITYSYGFSDGNAYIVSTDNSGNTFTNRISGYVFKDVNNDCIFDTVEDPLHKLGNQYWMVKVTPGPFGEPDYFTVTDENGYYEVPCGIETYTIKALPINELWTSTCIGSNVVTFTEPQLSDQDNNFGFFPTKACTKLFVDIAANNRFRQCREAAYIVNYCNNGTVSSDTSYVEIAFDENFIFDSATIGWEQNDAGNYIFSVGVLASGQCGMFTITGSTACDVVLGEAICSNAKIYPNSQCGNPQGFWDKSSISVEGECTGDSLVCFTITNNGKSMTDSTAWRLFTNDTLYQIGKVRLVESEVKSLCFDGNGQTLRLEVDQRPNHPGFSKPRSTVELCGDFETITGFVLSHPQDEEDEFVAVECIEITGSYDPNDKTVIPAGITQNNYISSNQQLEYTVRFQNTGNDTAFLVRIIDTLDVNTVNVSTLKPISASHNYTMRLSNSGRIEWIFDNIMLPDSSTDQLGSNGFVRFTIAQQSNAKGTQILNDAAIYFDYNAPIITNEAVVVVFDTVYSAINGIENRDFAQDITAKVFPNPTKDYVNIELSKAGFYSLLLSDITGRVLMQKFLNNTTKLNCTDLENGVYLYKILVGNELISTGKILKM